MRGYVTCKGMGKTFKWLIFPIHCSHCNGLGDIWVDNIDKYFEEQEIKED